MAAANLPSPSQAGYYLPPPPPSAAYPVQYQYASILSRFGATLIDSILLLVVTALVMAPLGILMATAALFNPAAVSWLSALYGPFSLVMFGVWVLYFTYFEGTSGQTLGKRALSLRVVSVATNAPPDFGHALVRNVLRVVDWLPFLYLIGFLCASLTPRKQRLGDIVADTVVVRC